MFCVRLSVAKSLSTLMFAALASMPVGAADLFSPVGRWQTATGESRYEVRYCGSEGRICAKLIWLRSDARTPENLAYLNQFVVVEAAPTASNRWTGDIAYDGQSIRGKMTLVGNDKMVLSGCQGMFCQTVEFERV